MFQILMQFDIKALKLNGYNPL